MADGATPANVCPPRYVEFCTYVREEAARHNLPSVAVAIAHKGWIVLQQGFGWADKEARTPATPGTMYRIASITKPMTATGLMRLVEAGKVDLDRPINDYLDAPGLVAHVGDARDATVRRVANHTAGIPQHWQFFFADRDRAAPTAEETIRHYGNIVRRPGERYEYTNIGYAALGAVIDRVSGERFADYMRERVFQPLGMTHSAIEPRPAQQRWLAAAYDQKGERLPDFRTDYPGGAGAFSSAHDLIRFAMFHLGRRIGDGPALLKRVSRDRMHARTATIDAGRGYGIGWRFDTVRGTIEHGGYFPGGSAIVRLVPGKDAAVVVLTNISNDDQAVALNAIADAALKTVVRDWKPLPPAPSSPPAFGNFVAPPALIGTWSGTVRTYAGDMPLTLEFLPNSEFARAKLGGQPATTLHNIRLDPVTATLAGDMHGVLNTPDAGRSSPYLLRFELKIEADAMSGTATTRYFLDPNGARLSHWTSLKKQ